MSDYYRVECTAIPDGIHQIGGKPTLRLSVILRPDPFPTERFMPPPDDTNAVPLLKWPEIIPQLPFMVTIGPDLANRVTIPVTPRFVLPPVPPVPPVPPGGTTDPATAWWATLWEKPEVRAAFARAMTPRTTATTPAEVETFSYAQLAELAIARAASDIEIGMLAGADLGLTGAAAARQADPHDPAIRVADAKSLLELDTFYDLPIDDAIDRARTGPLAQSGNDDDGPGFGAGPAPLPGLLGVYADIRKSINKAWQTPATAAAADAALRGTSWNPFLDPPARDALATVSAQELFAKRFRDPIFGKPVDRNALQASAASTTRLNLAAWRRSRNTDTGLGAISPPPVAASASATMTDAEADQAVGRTLAALQAHPALRKFVQLIVDIDIPLDTPGIDLATLEKGVVSVEIEDPANPGNARGRALRFWATAFELDPSAGLFEPCPEWKFATRGRSDVKSLVPSLPLDRGIVQLNSTRQNADDGSPRFRLEVVDANAATAAFVRGLQATVEASRKGSPDVPVDEPSLRTLGLALLDVEAMVPAQIAANKRAEAAPLLSSRTLLHAEDLVDGYRVDIVAPERVTIGGTEQHVVPGGARKMRYDVIDQAFGGAATNPYADVAARDHGYITIASRVWTADAAPAMPASPPASQTSAPVPVQRIMQSEMVFTWTGENIGLPAPRPVESVPDARRSADLKFVATYAFADQPGPILREGKGYRVMLRARKLNGSSVPDAVAESLLKHALGTDTLGKSYTYTPVERAPGPVILVPSPDRNSSRRDRTKLLVKTLIVSDEGAAVRMLVSPNIGLLRAEQQGQFDLPIGQFENAQAWARATRRLKRGSYSRLERAPDSPGFPVLPGSGDDKDRALLFKIVADSEPSSPYFVDNTLCFLGMRLAPTEATPEAAVGARHVTDELSFWNRRPADHAKPGQGFSPEAIVPIMLEAVPAVSDGQSRVYRDKDRKIGPAGAEITVPVLRVEVAPADTLKLTVWTNRLGETAVAHPAMQKALASIAARVSGLVPAGLGTRSPAEIEAWWAPFARTRRLAAQQEEVVFEIRHPVDRPRSPPKAVLLDARRYVDSETVFALGDIEIDRRSTSLVWAECLWYDSESALCLSRTAKPDEPWEIEPEGLYAYDQKKRRQGRLFTLDKIDLLPSRPGEGAAEYDSRANKINLATDETGKPRNLTASFRTYQARRLVVRLIARSRFAPAGFAPPDDASDPYSYSSSSADDRQLSRALDGSPEEGVKTVWLPATRRPAAPVVTQDRGTLYQRRFETSPGTSAAPPRVTLTHTYRCWLDGWFSSGPHELLAVVCRRPSVTPEPWLDAMLSRWGGDMTMAPGARLGSDNFPNYLRPEQLALASMIEIGDGRQISSIRKNVPLPVPAAGSGDGARNVDLALLRPVFHSGLGRWYCDIELRQAPTFRAILQLSVARYQERGLSGCQLSTAVAINAFQLHQPWTFSAVRRGRRIEISALGPAYRERAPMTRGLAGIGDVAGGIHPSVAIQAGAPRITVELERLTDGMPLPVVDGDGRPVVATNLNVVPTTNGADIPAGWSRWSIPLAIPSGRIDYDRLAVRISLASAHANSKGVPGSPDKSEGPLVYLPEPLTVQIEL
ncbi:MAG: hypothetical protein V4659_13530 [Pseudomonadota bacterium]